MLDGCSCVSLRRRPNDTDLYVLYTRYSRPYVLVCCTHIHIHVAHMIPSTGRVIDMLPTILQVPAHASHEEHETVARDSMPIPVLLVQRSLQYGRHVHGYSELMSSYTWPLDVDFMGPFELETLSIVEQFRLSARARIIVGAYGNGLTWIVNMIGGSVMMELQSFAAPHFVLCSGRWNVDSFSHYGGLAKFSGHNHICFRTRSEGNANHSDVDVELGFRHLDIYIHNGDAHDYLIDARHRVHFGEPVDWS